jgi:superfamily II DNA or RNA helicase
MSIKLNKSLLKPSEILDIKNDLFVEGIENEYGPAETLDCWGETKTDLYIPLSYSISKNLKADISYPKRNYKLKIDFKNDYQKEFYTEGFNILKKTRSVLMALPTNSGKTYSGIRFSQELKYKTAILVHRSILADQWKESIEKFTDASYQIVNTNEPLQDVDFYIFNIAFVSKYWEPSSKKWLQKNLENNYSVGTLIVDEAHIACASEMAKALQYFLPKYAIALTATPNRKDGLDKLLDLYFGSLKVVRISQTPFTVYKVSTGIKPVFGKNAIGKKKWGDVVQYLADSEDRNKIIVDLVKNNPTKIIMIMCKLKTHCDLLAEKLCDESLTVMKGTDRKYDKGARILISTFSKLGVGFDDQRLDMLILGCSVKEVEQYAGRLRYTEGKDRVIYDIVDDDFSCNQHWLERRRWYLSRNGEIKYVNMQKDKTPEIQRKRFAPKSV